MQVVAFVAVMIAVERHKLGVGGSSDDVITMLERIKFHPGLRIFEFLLGCTVGASLVSHHDRARSWSVRNSRRLRDAMLVACVTVMIAVLLIPVMSTEPTEGRWGGILAPGLYLVYTPARGAAGRGVGTRPHRAQPGARAPLDAQVGRRDIVVLPAAMADRADRRLGLVGARAEHLVLGRRGRRVARGVAADRTLDRTSGEGLVAAAPMSRNAEWAITYVRSAGRSRCDIEPASGQTDTTFPENELRTPSTPTREVHQERSVRIAAFSCGRNYTSARFRVRQFIPDLVGLGIDVHEYVAPIYKHHEPRWNNPAWRGAIKVARPFALTRRSWPATATTPAGSRRR